MKRGREGGREGVGERRDEWSEERREMEGVQRSTGRHGRGRRTRMTINGETNADANSPRMSTRNKDKPQNMLSPRCPRFI